jgi:type 1 glutamine amidotransferase
VKRPLTIVLQALAGLCLAGIAAAEKLPYANSKIASPTPEYCAKVESAAPARPAVAAARRKLLVFSLYTGYHHEVIPHVDRMLEILGKKSGAFDVAITRDIEQLVPEKLAGYDVLVLNNNCSAGPRRNLFLDVLEKDAKYSALDADQRQAKAAALERSILDFVRDGKGLVCIHGGVTILNNSKEFASMLGAAFDYHPSSNQNVTVRAVEPEHPLLAAFRNSGPLVHRDEAYAFKGVYADHNFRPLLVLDAAAVKDPSGRFGKTVRYIAWIKPYVRGRVFYCSPGHFPESYESPTLLRFLLDGIQYAAGDLKCEDGKK